MLCSNLTPAWRRCVIDADDVPTGPPHRKINARRRDGLGPDMMQSCIRHGLPLIRTSHRDTVGRHLNRLCPKAPIHPRRHKWMGRISRSERCLGMWTILHIGYVGRLRTTLSNEVRCRRLPSSLNHRHSKHPFHPQMHSLRDRLHPHDWHCLMKARGTLRRNSLYELASSWA